MDEYLLDLLELFELAAKKAIAILGLEDVKFSDAGHKDGNIYYVHFINHRAGTGAEKYPSVLFNLQVLHTRSTGSGDIDTLAEEIVRKLQEQKLAA